MTTLTTAPTHQITTTANRSIFGKRTKGFSARIEGPTHATTDVYGESISDAKGNLLAYLATIEEHHTRRRYVICGDGTVLAIYWFSSGWAYDIIDSTRTAPAGCMTCHTSLDRVTADAKTHAEQSYGGVVRVI